jgi:RNA polymerase sigma factor (sigma-70 family)
MPDLNQPPGVDCKLVELVLAARAGDSSAWPELIDRFDTTLRNIAASCRLASADVDDVVQSTWLALLQDLQRLREPAAVAGWLAIVTRREAIRVHRTRAREQLTDDVELSGDPARPGPEASALASERRAVLTRALATLPDRHHRLMTLLLAQPTLDYQQISERLAIPVGSIGPIRSRALTRLSRHPELCRLREGQRSVVNAGIPECLHKVHGGST